MADRLSRKCKSSYSKPSVEYEDIISDIGKLNKDISKKEISKQGVEFLANDILYGKLRPYLKNWILPTFQGVAVGDFWVLRTRNAISSYLFYLIQTEQFQNVANQSVGTKMPRADWNLVSETMFYYPSLPEQKKIGEYFQKLDSLITAQTQKVEKLKQLKKAMLEKLFV